MFDKNSNVAMFKVEDRKDENMLRNYMKMFPQNIINDEGIKDIPNEHTKEKFYCVRLTGKEAYRHMNKFVKSVRKLK